MLSKLLKTAIFCCVILFNVATVSSTPCSPWAEWTACDSQCMRERNRMYCDPMTESQRCDNCVVAATNTSGSTSKCGEWVEWSPCDSICTRERYRMLCGNDVQVEKCASCTTSQDSMCGDYTAWQCDTKACVQVRTRSCVGGVEIDKGECPDCGSTDTDESGTDFELSEEGTEEEPDDIDEEGGVSVAAAAAMGVGGVLGIAGLAAGTLSYTKRIEAPETEAELMYEPEDIGVEEQAKVFLEQENEVEADVAQEDWKMEDI